MFSFTILPEIMTDTRDATLSSALIHPRTVIQAERMRYAQTFCEDFVYCQACVGFTVDLNDDRLLDVCRTKTHQGDAMNLYRYAMFIARACRGSFVGNVLFANPRMALFSMLV